MSYPARTLRRGHTRTSEDLRALLQAVFIGELLAPSQEIWLVSPWVSDIGVVNNTDGAFTGLEPSWGARHVRLSEILLRLAARGTESLSRFGRTNTTDGSSSGCNRAKMRTACR